MAVATAAPVWVPLDVTSRPYPLQAAARLRSRLRGGREAGQTRWLGSSGQCAAALAAAAAVACGARSGGARPPGSRRVRGRIGAARSVALRAINEGGAQQFLSAPLRGKAIVVGWDQGWQPKKEDEIPWNAKDSLDELVNLCESLDVPVKYRVIQAWRKDRGRTMPIGKGKQQELREQVEYDPEIGVVAFDMDLKPKNLITMKGRIDPHGDVAVLDRTTLILRIFAARARTQEAKLQVKLASQQFLKPMLAFYLTTGGGLEMGGGSGGARTGGAGGALRGAGESQLSLDKFYMNKAITRTRKELEEVRKHRAAQRKMQQNYGLPVIALVGYTNAGKSSLLNRLFGGNEVVTKDRLFETLDPTRRRISLAGNREALIVDTVGFVQRLPTALVDGFRATLEELCEATVVLHVVDVSSATVAEQVGTVQRTLKELRGFDETTPQLLVFNKTDKLEGGIADELRKRLFFPWPGVVGHVQISALTGFGLTDLSQAIEDTLVNHTDFGAASMKLLLPYTEAKLYNQLKSENVVKINSDEPSDEGWLLEVVARKDDERRLKPFEIASSDSKKTVSVGAAGEADGS